MCIRDRPIHALEDIQTHMGDPGCMCEYFPSLTDGVCDEDCYERSYDYDSCSSIIPSYGLIWGIEYGWTWFVKGLLGHDDDVALTPLLRTEHSCWFLLSTFTFPLMVLIVTFIVSIGVSMSSTATMVLLKYFKYPELIWVIVGCTCCTGAALLLLLISVM